MPAYTPKETGNGRQGYLNQLAEDYETEQAALRAAHEAAAPTFTVWGVECPVLFGRSSSICLAANGEGFYPMASTEEAKATGMQYACFQTNGWSQRSVENAVFEWATEIAHLGGCWE